MLHQEALGNLHLTSEVNLYKRALSGKGHKNLVFDTRAYMVELADGSIDEYTANATAENIYAQINED